jgi:hypothetical protein
MANGMVVEQLFVCRGYHRVQNMSTLDCRAVMRAVCFG